MPVLDQKVLPANIRLQIFRSIHHSLKDLQIKHPAYLLLFYSTIISNVLNYLINIFPVQKPSNKPDKLYTF